MSENLKTYFAGMWFVVILIPTILLGALIFFSIHIFMLDRVLQGANSTPSLGFNFFPLVSFPFLLTNLFFRRCYKMIEKLYPFSIFALCDLFILSISEKIMDYGYDVMDPTRHALTVFAILIQFILCRIIMGIYFKKHPFN